MGLGFRGFPKIRGTVLGVPLIRTNYSILGSMLGCPYFGKLPKTYIYICICPHTYNV